MTELAAANVLLRENPSRLALSGSDGESEDVDMAAEEEDIDMAEEENEEGWDEERFGEEKLMEGWDK